MAQTFSQLQQQIQVLQSRAEKLRQQEVKGVVVKIREAIATYGLSQQDLFGNGASTARPSASLNGGSQPSVGPGKSKSKAKNPTPKFADGNGNTWVGLGKRPRWLQEALASGRALQEFLISGGTNGAANGALAAGNEQPRNSGAASPFKKNGAKKAGKGGKGMYRDGAGNSWSGRGPRPRWLKEAIAGGKPLESLRA